MPAIDLTQNKKIAAKMQKLGKHLQKRIGDALLAAGRELLKQSQELVPVETGQLRDSGKVRRFAFKGWQTFVQVGYGDYNVTSYAVYVHENTLARHGAAYNAYYANKSINKDKDNPKRLRRPQEQAKFLEYPLRNRLAEIRAAFEKKMLSSK